jgi:RNA-directed DNA polymerase
VRDTLNRKLRGWSNYFSYGARRAIFRGVDRYVYERVCNFLAKRHKVAGRGTRRLKRLTATDEFTKEGWRST